MMKIMKPLYLLLSLLLVGCGTDQQLMPGSSVAITPSSKELNITEILDENGQCIWYEDNELDIPLVIQVLDAGGAPVGNADLTVYVDWSGNTFPNGLEALKLYEDLNGNGVVDHPSELVSGAGDAIYRTQTEEYTGEKLLLLRINLSCEYKGDVYAISDGYTGFMNVNVTSQN